MRKKNILSNYIQLMLLGLDEFDNFVNCTIFLNDFYFPLVFLFMMFSL